MTLPIGGVTCGTAMQRDTRGCIRLDCLLKLYSHMWHCSQALTCRMKPLDVSITLAAIPSGTHSHPNFGASWKPVLCTNGREQQVGSDEMRWTQNVLQTDCSV